MYLKFRAFRAVNEPETCRKFKEEHRNVLRDYGITNITTNTDEWMEHPGTYCVIVQSFIDEKILGGVRIQISDENTSLPVELAIGNMDSGIYDIVKNFRNNGGVGELCALWNAKEIAGMGISLLLVRAVVAASSQLPISTLMCICADYTLQMFRQVGFIADNSLGNDGGFPYPNANYTARVLGIMNPMMLDSADATDKLRIQSLRDDPGQSADESGTSGNITVQYDLRILK